MIALAELHTRPEDQPLIYIGSRSGDFRALDRFARGLTFIMFVILTFAASGCVNSEIAAGRADLTTGNYAAAHERFTAAARSGKLSASEQRELSDGLCLTEFKLGPPEYPLAEQRQTCAAAADRSGSSSAQIVASIDATERADIEASVHHALTDDDPAEAESEVIRYQTFPGADQTAVASWSTQIWATIDQDEKRSTHRDRHLPLAIAAISQRYPKVRSMDDAAFKRWVMTNATVSNSHLVNRVDLRGHTLDLHVTSRNLPDIAFNLDHFIRINDAMVARCRCDGQTNIAVEGSGLPVYLVRLDTDTRNSAALIMPQPN